MAMVMADDYLLPCVGVRESRSRADAVSLVTCGVCQNLRCSSAVSKAGGGYRAFGAVFSGVGWLYCGR